MNGKAFKSMNALGKDVVGTRHIVRSRDPRFVFRDGAFSMAETSIRITIQLGKRRDTDSSCKIARSGRNYFEFFPNGTKRTSEFSSSCSPSAINWLFNTVLARISAYSMGF